MRHGFRTWFLHLWSKMMASSSRLFSVYPRRWSLGSIDGGWFPNVVDAWCTTCASPVAEIFNDTLEWFSKMNAEYVDLFGELLVNDSQEQSS